MQISAYFAVCTPLVSGETHALPRGEIVDGEEKNYNVFPKTNDFYKKR